MEEVSIETILDENQKLSKELTKRNEQYLFDLRKGLQLANYDEEQIARVFHGMLPELIEGQKTGVTARQLYGTVSEKTQSVIETPYFTNPSATWKVALDGGLMMLGMFALLGAVTASIGNTTGPKSGVITILSSAIIGAMIYVFLHKFVYVKDEKGQTIKPGLLKPTLVMIPSMLLWAAVYTLTMSLPETVNVVLPPVGNLILAAAAFGGKFYAKKMLGTETLGM